MLTLYVDGSCLGNPGPGGWAVYCATDVKLCSSGAMRHTTNQEAELFALKEAFARLRPGLEVEIISDSQYAVGAAHTHKVNSHRRLIDNIREYMVTHNGKVMVRWEPRDSSEGNREANRMAQRKALEQKRNGHV